MLGERPIAVGLLQQQNLRKRQQAHFRARTVQRALIGRGFTLESILQLIVMVCATQPRDHLQQFGAGNRDSDLLEGVSQLRSDDLRIIERIECAAYQGGAGHLGHRRSRGAGGDAGHDHVTSRYMRSL
jgi:hypothetical protein